MSVSAPFRRVHVEALGERTEVRVKEPCVHQTAVHQHQRLARAVLVVPGLHVTELYVLRHPLVPSSWVSLRQTGLLGPTHRRPRTLTALPRLGATGDRCPI